MPLLVFAGESGSHLYVAAEGEFDVIKETREIGIIFLNPSAA